MNQPESPIEISIRNPLSSLPEADGLRAIAALLVFFYHVYGVLYQPITNAPKCLLANLIYSGATGVTLFFLLSGFLLSRPYWERGIHSGDALKFFKNRLLRIYPMFAAVITSAVVASQADNRYWLGLKSLFMCFSANDFSIFSIPWWTLRTEFEFYLIMTLFLLNYRYRTLNMLYMVLIIGAVLLVLCTYQGGIPASVNVRFLAMQSAIAYLPVFGAGILLAWVNVFHARNKLIPKKLYVLGDAILALCVYRLCVTLQEVSLARTINLELTGFSHHYIEAFYWTGILATLALLGSYTGLLLSAAIPNWLGQISYSFYLVHLPVVFFIGGPLKEHASFLLSSNIAVSGIVVVGCFFFSAVLAHLGHTLIETPFLKLKSRSINRDAAIVASSPP